MLIALVGQSAVGQCGTASRRSLEAARVRVLQGLGQTPGGQRLRGQGARRRQPRRTHPAGSGVATVAHEPIKTMNWPAMTMGFNFKDKVLLDDGKEVEFEFVQDDKDYVITSVG